MMFIIPFLFTAIYCIFYSTFRAQWSSKEYQYERFFINQRITDQAFYRSTFLTRFNSNWFMQKIMMSKYDEVKAILLAIV